MQPLKMIVTTSLLFLLGCANWGDNPERPLADYYRAYHIAAPISAADFTTCNRPGCRGQAEVGLSKEQWRQVGALFTPLAPDAAREREQIAAAIALLERLVGRQNNTFADQACNQFREPLESHQLDCIAEATNTTVYLQLLQRGQLLRWHRVGYPARRQRLLLFVPHNSATIRQQDSGARYAVDSWFHANGEKPELVPLQRWLKHQAPASCR